jgi:PAS domain S-box-containing protein
MPRADADTPAGGYDLRDPAGSQGRFAAIVQDAHDGVIAKDLDGIITAWNPAAQRMYGYTPQEAIGRHISMIVPGDHAREEQVILDKIKSGERLDTYETERIRKDGVRIDVSLTVSPIRDADGNVVGASIVARDITAEKRRRSTQAFMARVGARFHASLDPQTAAQTIVETAVPELCELCVIDQLQPDGTVGDAAVAAADDDLAEGLRALRRTTPLDPDGTHPVAQVIRSRRPAVLQNLDSERMRAQVAQSREHERFIAEQGYRSAVVIPMVARGRLLGTISFLHVRNDRIYDEEDLDLFGDIGERAAMAIDNARLYRERSDIATTLQRVLRPDAPLDVPGVEIEAVYEPAGEDIEVGGDFYDLFEASGSWFLLIGDVVGKGPAAAGLTGQIRHTVRALALPGWGPAEILEHTNGLLYEQLTEGRFATAQLLALRPNEGGPVKVEFASAGHPPAVLCGADGARFLGGGVVLGVTPDPHISSSGFKLNPADVLVLYTDGWLEAGPVSVHRTTEALAEELGEMRELPLAEALDRLRRDALNRAGEALNDDLVLLGVRARPG